MFVQYFVKGRISNRTRYTHGWTKLWAISAATRKNLTREKEKKKNVLCEHYVSIDYRAIGCHEYKHCSFYSLLPTNYWLYITQCLWMDSWIFFFVDLYRTFRPSVATTLSAHLSLSASITSLLFIPNMLRPFWTLYPPITLLWVAQRSLRLRPSRTSSAYSPVFNSLPPLFPPVLTYILLLPNWSFVCVLPYYMQIPRDP